MREGTDTPKPIPPRLDGVCTDFCNSLFAACAGCGGIGTVYPTKVAILSLVLLLIPIGRVKLHMVELT